jgi:diguanylate cyclase (GGDEF)-like protein/PAS domain S-box-containing protein
VTDQQGSGDARLRAIYEAMACGVIVRTAGGEIHYANQAAMRIYGVQNMDELAAADTTAAMLAGDGSMLDERPSAKALRTLQPVRDCTVGRMFADGRVQWRLVDAVPLFDPDGIAREVVSSFIDITARKEAERALREQALLDPLTQLPNRTLLKDRWDHAIELARRDREPLALILLDLDHFKEANDTFGHPYGDLLLRAVARRIASAVRASDTIGRLGGDEFAVLLPNTNEVGAQIAARKLLTALEEPFDIDEQVLEVTASIGIALYPRHGEDGSTLLRRADIAMYTAKRSGAGSAIYNYEDEVDEDAPHRLRITAELRQAVEKRELALLYQPIVELASGRASHAEGLLRWRHPLRGIVTPDHFMPAVERSGLIRPVFGFALSSALAQCAAWRSAGLDMRVAVNLSVRNLLDPGLIDVVSEAIQVSGITASWLGLEITESMLMVDPERSLKSLTKLRNMGISLSIDDFGTGYSSLAYLQRLPVYAVKIDQSFIRDMSIDVSSRAIVEATVDLAHRLGLKAIAEGVETQAEYDALRAIGCDFAQGYLIARPLAPGSIARWIVDREQGKIVDLHRPATQAAGAEPPAEQTGTGAG